MDRTLVPAQDRPPANRFRAPVHVWSSEGQPRALPKASSERVPSKRRRPTWFRRLRLVLELVLAGAAVYAVYSQRHQLAAGAKLLGHVRWRWLALGVAFEASSMVVFARLQRWLLRSGDVDLGMGAMVEITLAGNSLSMSLPGGVAWGASFAYEQLRRRGADRTLAGWVLLVAGALSSFALFLVFVAGVEIAGNQGPTSSLRIVVLGLVAIPVVAGALLLAAHRSPAVRRGASRGVAWSEAHLPRGEPTVGALRHLVERIKTVRPSRRVWAVAMSLAVANWLCDAATLFACIKALGLSVPWTGLLVAYSLAQVSASLPITPGGIGVVEGSLTFALVAYGMADQAAVASALMYRIVSFWGLIPVGWSAWAWLELQQRRGVRGDRHHPWAWHHHSGHDEGGAAAHA